MLLLALFFLCMEQSLMICSSSSLLPYWSSPHRIILESISISCEEPLYIDRRLVTMYRLWAHSPPRGSLACARYTFRVRAKPNSIVHFVQNAVGDSVPFYRIRRNIAQKQSII